MGLVSGLSDRGPILIWRSVYGLRSHLIGRSCRSDATEPITTLIFTYYYFNFKDVSSREKKTFIIAALGMVGGQDDWYEMPQFPFMNILDSRIWAHFEEPEIFITNSNDRVNIKVREKGLKL